MYDLNNCPGVAHFLNCYDQWKKHQHGSTKDQSFALPKIFQSGQVDQLNEYHWPTAIIDMLHEGPTELDRLEQYSKAKHYIIFTQWVDQSKIELPANCTLVAHNYLLFDLAREYYNPNSWYYYSDKTYKFEQSKPCLFAHVSSSHNKRRDGLRDKFIQQQLDTDNYIFRYGGHDYGKNINGIDIATAGTQQECRTQLSTTGIDAHFMWRSAGLPVFNMAHFNLVIETYKGYAVEDHYFFMTEKTVKPLLVGQPFVIMAAPGWLAKLRELGFKTFDALWDESYDQEADEQKRLDMIANLCADLGQFDWLGNQPELKNICNHNRTHFLNMPLIAENEFLEFEKAMNNLVENGIITKR